MTTYFLFFDIETTGLLGAKKTEINYCNSKHFPHIVQVSWQLHRFENGIFTTISTADFIIRPDGYTIPPESSKIHGITHETALEKGASIKSSISHFIDDLTSNPNTYLVCHNIEFDVTILFYHLFKNDKERFMKYKNQSIPCICTMLDSVALCKLPSMSKFTKPNDPYKYPKLSELYRHLFGSDPVGQLHNSRFDVECTIMCFRELMKRELLTVRNANFTFE
jgi:DNA polymerase III epsilon subunit-like protein